MRTRSEPPSTPLSPVSCDILDAQVVDYLTGEGLIEDDADIHDRSRISRMAAYAAFQQLREGDVRHAIAIMQELFSDVLQDQRLVFKLKRQQFIELLRQGTPAGDEAALACAREELAPLALDAYPEAYLDFKKSLLMLIQPQAQQQQQQSGDQQQQGPQPQQQQQQQQQQCDWSVEARHKFAEVLYHTILQQIGWSRTQLEQQLAYLLHIFSLYTSGSHTVSSSSGRGSSSHTAQIQQLLSCPEADLAAGVLLEGRDEAALPPDVSGQGYMERDVQALMSAVSITRSAAVDALKGAAGDAAAALGHQLSRFRLNKQQLDFMAWEYAVARGLVEPSDGPVIEAAAAEEDEPSDMDIDLEPVVAAAAVAGSSNSSKRNTAAAATVEPVSSATVADDLDQAAAQSSPFQAAAAAAGEAAATAAAAAGGAAAPSINVSCPARSAAGSMLRSASQSPPYKVPRWRCKQTPSRFKDQPAAAAAAAAAGVGDHELQQVVVSGGGEDDGVQEGGGSISRKMQHITDQPGVSGKRSSSGRPQQQQQQQRDYCADAAYIVDQVSKQQQQHRWQQLQQQLKSHAAAAGSSLEQQQSLQKLQGLVKQGRYKELEELLEYLQPGLLQEYPVILFDIKRLQFTKLIQNNQVPAALQLARSQLTPLADKHPELLPSLKASMALLLPGHSSSSSSTGADTDDSTSFLATLLPLLQSKLGIEPPRLVKLLRLLLTCHKGWFKIQRCQDPFAAALGLDKLAQTGGGAAAAAAAGGGSRGAAGRGSDHRSQQQQQQQSSGPGGSTAAVRTARPGSAVAAVAAELAAAARQALLDDPLDLNGTGAAAAVASGGGGGDAMDVHDEDEDEEDAGPMFAEAAVLQVMEVLELPRAAALELLAEHGGDAQAAIMQVFG